MYTIRIRRRTALLLAVGVLLAIPAVARATHLFGDVPDGSTHAAGITFMRDSGVTLGCGDGTNFCPDDSVNRAQMATFMHRLSGNAPGTAPSVNAAQLGGQVASAYQTVVVGAMDSAAPGHGGGLGAVTAADGILIAATAEITVPAAGVLVVHNTTSWNNGTEHDVLSWVELDTVPACDNAFDGDNIAGTYALDGGSTQTLVGFTTPSNTAGIGMAPVHEAGTHTVYHCVAMFAGAEANIDHALLVQWLPANSATIVGTILDSGEIPAAPEGSFLGSR